MGDFREADYTLPDHVLQSPVNDGRWDERGSEVETAPDPLPRPFPEPRAGAWSASACLGGCFGEGPVHAPPSDFLLGLLWPGPGNSGQRRDSGVGQPGRDPEAALPLPQGRAPPAVPLVPGERAAPPRAAGPTTLVSAREGEYGMDWEAQV